MSDMFEGATLFNKNIDTIADWDYSGLDVDLEGEEKIAASDHAAEP